MEECTKALDTLIHLVEEDPVLQRPDYDRPFEMEVDASQYATGAILYQRNDRQRLCPVGYHSQTLNPAERGYDVHDRELLALIRDLRHWRHLLLSSPFTTIVHTDHNNLRYYRMPQRINRRVARYLSDLVEYDYQLVHRPGKLNKADALSQPLGVEEGKHDNEDILILPEKLFAHAVEVSDLAQRILEGQMKTPDYFKKLNLSYPLNHLDNHWYHQQQPVVPEDLGFK
jgi:RNase H-like domain found in reverse transcriptase